MVNVFIAEDDREDFLLLAEAIENVLPKFNVYHSRDGKAFLQSLNEDVEPDLIFLDLNMPKKNGVPKKRLPFTNQYLAESFQKVIRFKDIASSEFPVEEKEENKIMHMLYQSAESNVLMFRKVWEKQTKMRTEVKL